MRVTSLAYITKNRENFGKGNERIDTCALIAFPEHAGLCTTKGVIAVGATRTIDVDFDRDPSSSIYDAIDDGLVCDRFEFVDDDFEPHRVNLSGLLGDVVKQIKEQKVVTISGFFEADWTTDVILDNGDDLEASGAEGALVIRIREGSELVADGKVIVLRNISVSWSFPAEFDGCWMDPLEGVILAVDFETGRVYTRRWPR